MAQMVACLPFPILSVPWSIRVTALPEPEIHLCSQSTGSGTEHDGIKYSPCLLPASSSLENFLEQKTETPLSSIMTLLSGQYLFTNCLPSRIIRPSFGSYSLEYHESNRHRSDEGMLCLKL